jgi:cellulose synthase/poly-beta-1,6-N-acetylglucosamine synthase-like glycosyltransferase
MSVMALADEAVLGVFIARRCVLGAASLLPRRPVTPDQGPSVTVLVAAHDEELCLPRLLAALDALDYPRERLSFVVVSDGSADRTAAILEGWAARTAGALAIVLPTVRGKGGALQAAFEAAPVTELVAVFDADTEPQPDALAWLAGAFADPAVGGACGYPDPGRAHRTAAAKYAVLERWVTHLITLRGKDRLKLRPQVIGAICCFRREALVEAGGFPTGVAAEDVQLSLAITRNGWDTRWIGEAVAREEAPADLAGFRRQRLRWSRGLMSTGPRARGAEDLMTALGYLDRLAFLAGVVMALIGAMPPWLLLAYAAVPMLLILLALWRAGAAGKASYCAAVPAMAVADIGVTLESAAAQLVGAPLRWRARPRARST